MITVETSNLFLPLYSLMVEDHDDEDEDPTESPTLLPSCSNESTKPEPPSTKATSTSSLSTKPTSAYTLYGMQDCPTHWNNHFKKCLVPAMNKQFKKNGENMLKSVSKRSTHISKISRRTPHLLYPNHGHTKHDYSMAPTE